MAHVNITAELAQIVNGLANDATDVNDALVKIIAAINGGLDNTNLSSSIALLASGIMHGDLSSFSSPTYMHKAASIKLIDTLSKYTATEVESALAEIAEYVGLGITGNKGLSYCGYSEDPTIPNNCEVTASANAGVSGLIINFSANLRMYSNVGSNLYLPLEVNIDNTGWQELSSDSDHVDKFHLYLACSGGADVIASLSKTSLFTTTDTPAYDPTKETKIRFGTEWVSTGSIAYSTSVYSMLVQAIR